MDVEVAAVTAYVRLVGWWALLSAGALLNLAHHYGAQGHPGFSAVLMLVGITGAAYTLTLEGRRRWRKRPAKRSTGTPACVGAAPPSSP